MPDITIEALRAILQSMEKVIDDMDNMVKWWTPVIDVLAMTEDMAYSMRSGADFDDNALKIICSRIIRALDLYCDAVSLEDNFLV